jgi:hypothetical protein
VVFKDQIAGHQRASQGTDNNQVNINIFHFLPGLHRLLNPFLGNLHIKIVLAELVRQKLNLFGIVGPKLSLKITIHSVVFGLGVSDEIDHALGCVKKVEINLSMRPGKTASILGRKSIGLFLLECYLCALDYKA